MRYEAVVKDGEKIIKMKASNESVPSVINKWMFLKISKQFKSNKTKI